MSNWINNQEQQPLEPGDYLVYTDGFFTDVDYWDGSNWDHHYDGHDTVTHWQQLPAPPIETVFDLEDEDYGS